MDLALEAELVGRGVDLNTVDEPLVRAVTSFLCRSPRERCAIMRDLGMAHPEDVTVEAMMRHVHRTGQRDAFVAAA